MRAGFTTGAPTTGRNSVVIPTGEDGRYQFGLNMRVGWHGGQRRRAAGCQDSSSGVPRGRVARCAESAGL